MNDSRKTALQLQKQYSLFRPSLDDLVLVVSDLGYEIVDFDPKNKSVEMLIQKLMLTNDILAQSAFVYSNNDVKLVFLRYDLTVDEKLYALTHELGHIALGHVLTTGRSSVVEEFQAHEFTHHLLNPSPIVKTKAVLYTHKRISIIVFALVTIALLTMGYIFGASHHIEYINDFYITPTGLKYHRSTCRVIKGKNSARKMTKEEYESGLYEPCSICVPEE